MFELWVALCSVVLAVSLSSYWKWRNSAYVKTLDKIPGPKGYPFIGIIPLVPREKGERLNFFHDKLMRKYGRIFRFWIFSKPAVCISSPLSIEVLLNSQKHIDKGEFYHNFLHSWLGNGLLLASGERWRRSRRLLTPAFHFQILDNFFDVFNRNADIFCQQLSSDTCSSDKKEIDIFPYLKRCTLDIICETAMGISVNAQTNHDSEYITAVRRTSEILTRKLLSAWQLVPDWIFRSLSSQGREYFKHLNVMHEFTSKIIEERKIEIDQEDIEKVGLNDSSLGIKKRRAFLDLLLIEAKKGAELSDIDIRNEVDTFMFEGHDTTASAMVWFLYCMATHPDQQNLVCEELDQVFGDSARPCSLEDTAQLKYLECCLKESLRLYPSVPVIERAIMEDIDLDGYTIPAGTSVSMQIFSLHRNEDYFPDPLSYRPERFQNGERHPFAFIPFSAGPRNCIGQRFALMEEKVILSSLLRRFHFTYDGIKNGPIKPCFELVLKPENGLPLLVNSR